FARDQLGCPPMPSNDRHQIGALQIRLAQLRQFVFSNVNALGRYQIHVPAFYRVPRVQLTNSLRYRVDSSSPVATARMAVRYVGTSAALICFKLALIGFRQPSSQFTLRL